MELADARFREAEPLADLVEGARLLIAKLEDGAVPFAELRYHVGKDAEGGAVLRRDGRIGLFIAVGRVPTPTRSFAGVLLKRPFE